MDQLLAIKAFSRVVESGSFTRAADSLNMPKATLSKLFRSWRRISPSGYCSVPPGA